MKTPQKMCENSWKYIPLQYKEIHISMWSLMQNEAFIQSTEWKSCVFNAAMQMNARAKFSYCSRPEHSCVGIDNV